jgi:hypothetical protein
MLFTTSSEYSDYGLFKVYEYGFSPLISISTTVDSYVNSLPEIDLRPICDRRKSVATVFEIGGNRSQTDFNLVDHTMDTSTRMSLMILRMSAHRHIPLEGQGHVLSQKLFSRTSQHAAVTHGL